MGHKGSVLRPRCIRPVRVQTQIIFYSTHASRNLKHIVLQSTLITIYYAYIHSISSYGIILGGISSNANKLFILKKKIVRMITNSRVRESCREALKNKQIMTLYSQYIFLLIIFTVNTNTYSPLTTIYMNTKLGATLTYIYQLLI